MAKWRNRFERQQSFISGAVPSFKRRNRHKWDIGLGPYSRPVAQFFPIRTSRQITCLYFLPTLICSVKKPENLWTIRANSLSRSAGEAIKQATARVKNDLFALFCLRWSVCYILPNKIVSMKWTVLIERVLNLNIGNSRKANEIEAKIQHRCSLRLRYGDFSLWAQEMQLNKFF